MNNIEWFDFIAQTSGDIISRHTLGGQFLDVSESGIDILGYDKAELLSIPLCSVVHELDTECIRNYHTLLVNERITQWIQFRFRRKNGIYINLRSLGKVFPSQTEPEGFEIIMYSKLIESFDNSPYSDETRGLHNEHSDVTGSTANNMLRYYNKLIEKYPHRITPKIPIYNSEEEYKVLYRAISHSTNGITIADCRLPDMPLVYANPAFELMTGYSLEEVLGINCRFLHNHDKEQEGLTILRKAIQSAEPVKVVLRNFKKDGTLFWNQLELSPVFDNEGTLTHFVGIASDITQEVVARNEITELNMRLAETNDLLRQERDSERQHAKTLEKLNDMKNDFVSSVSHEFRTPLASIIGFAQTLLRDKHLPETLREKFTKIIHDDGKRLARIVEDLLDIARIESGKTSVYKKNQNIVQTVKDALTAVKLDAEKNNINTTFHSENEVINAQFDKDKITQVLINLLTNACKFSHPNSSVDVRITQDANLVTVHIIDHGIGIHSEDIPHIFEKFYRVKHTGKEIRGTGLGLPIAKNLIELHNGTITVTSVYGEGSEFAFSIPK